MRQAVGRLQSAGFENQQYVDRGWTGRYGALKVVYMLQLRKLKELLSRICDVLLRVRDVPYVSVPVWKPWRDYDCQR